MPKFAANLTMLFTEHPISSTASQRPRSAGFEACRVPVPLCVPDGAAGRARSSTTADAGAAQPARRRLGGGRARHRLPCRTASDEFQDGVGEAIEYATALACPQVNCLAGIAPPGVIATQAARHLRRQPAALPPASSKQPGIKLLIEPINTCDIPGFFLTRTDQALELIDEVGSDNLFLQYDIYHMQIMEGDLAGTIERNLDAHRPYPACRQSRPQRAGHGRDQLPVPVRAARPRSATPAGSAASTSRRARRAAGLGWARRRYPSARQPATQSTARTETRDMSKVGFIGLGIMGRAHGGAPARRAATSCSSTTSASVPEELIEAGAHRAARSGKEVAQNGRHHHHHGARHARTWKRRCSARTASPRACRTGKIVVDMSSISPIATKDFAQPHQRARLRLPRRAGLRRRGRRQGGLAHHHGRRPARRPSTRSSRCSS